MMNDTSLEIQKKQEEIFNKKTPTERFHIADEMIQFGRQMLEDDIREQNPNISDIDLKLAVFKRCYEDYYTDDEMKSVLESMRKYHTSNQ